MRIYKLYATGSTTAAAASVTIAKTGRIKSICWDVTLDAAGDNGSGQAELSLVPVSFVGVNDSRGPIDQVSIWQNMTTSGMGNAMAHPTRSVDVPVGLGEKLYLNIATSATVTATCFIHVDD